MINLINGKFKFSLRECFPTIKIDSKIFTIFNYFPKIFILCVVAQFRTVALPFSLNPLLFIKTLCDDILRSDVWQTLYCAVRFFTRLVE